MHNKSSTAARKVLVGSVEGADLSQFHDSLEAAIILFGLEPAFSETSRLYYEPSLGELKRRQLNALKVIQTFSQKELNESCKDFGKNSQRGSEALFVLLITKEDLFIEGMNFVFGLAVPGSGMAVLSVNRLTKWNESLTPSLVKERILKEAAHEIGHLLGLKHCKLATCIMSFSQNLEQVDQKLPIACIDCLSKAREGRLRLGR